MSTKRNTITKAEAPLDVWTAEALNEFDRLGLATPTAEECKDAYAVGESPATWAAYVAGTVST